MNRAKVSGENFNVSLGYTVSGTVSYSGSYTGWIYLSLVNNDCSGSGGNGTNIVYPFTSGPNFINPVDISYCQYCGDVEFPYLFSTGGATPTVGGTYAFTVTYSDGTQDTGSPLSPAR